MLALRLSVCAALLVTSAVLAAPAIAAGSVADREAARSLATKAYQLFEAREYRRAIDLFHQADARFHAPPHLLYVARAQVELGLLVEAKATYLRVLQDRLAADAPPPFKEAQVSARSELTEVEALTPTVVVTLPGPLPSGARVEIDGEALAAGDLGRPLPRNPGAHTVSLEAPGMASVERTVIMKSGGGDQHVDLPLDPPASRTVVPAAILLALGAAGVGVGTAGAILLHSASPARTSDLRVAEIAGFAAGGAAIVTGVVLLALRPRASSALVSGPAARLRIGVGPGSVSVGGAF
jgi:hypothetical protein